MKRIGDIKPQPVQITYRDYMIAAQKARRKRRVSKEELFEMFVPFIDRKVAINVYTADEFYECLFVDCVDVCKSHTTIHHSKNSIEVYPVRPLRFETRFNSTTIYYKNNTSLEIIRLN